MLVGMVCYICACACGPPAARCDCEGRGASCQGRVAFRISMVSDWARSPQGRIQMIQMVPRSVRSRKLRKTIGCCRRPSSGQRLGKWIRKGRRTPGSTGYRCQLALGAGLGRRTQCEYHQMGGYSTGSLLELPNGSCARQGSGLGLGYHQAGSQGDGWHGVALWIAGGRSEFLKHLPRL
jgi:hypothetical protein